MRIANTKRGAVPGPSRRTVLRTGVLSALAVGVGPVAACDPFDDGPDRNLAADLVAPLIGEADDLAGRYAAAVAAFPELADRLDPVAEAHRKHATELGRITGAPSRSPAAGPSGAASPPAADVKAALAALRAAEQEARASAVRVCLDAPAALAATIGSVAAARTSHLEVLR